jgi:HEAT repeat protein
MRALALIADERSVPTLFDALDDDAILVNYWANEGLERLGIGIQFYSP